MPWILVPYYTFATWLGTKLLDMPGRGLPTDMKLSGIFSVEFLEWIASQWVLLIPAFVGSSLLAAFLAVIAYKTASLSLNRFRKSGTEIPDTLDA